MSTKILSYKQQLKIVNNELAIRQVQLAHEREIREMETVNLLELKEQLEQYRLDRPEEFES